MSFYVHLKKQGLAKSTIHRLVVWSLGFESWCTSYGKLAKELKTKDLLYYLETEKGSLSSQSLQLLLKRIAHYYDYLGLENPLSSFKLKGGFTRKSYVYLSSLSLRQIYQSYIQNPRLTKESKVLVGFLVFQGLATKELRHLKVGQLDLSKAILELKDSHLAGRILGLEAIQLLLLLDYIKAKKGNDALFNYKNASHLQNKHIHLVYQINKEMRKHNLGFSIENLGQLRASRIRCWISDYGILEAQYLAGHYRLSSTQAYDIEDVETLRQAFEKSHPLFKKD